MTQSGTRARVLVCAPLAVAYAAVTLFALGLTGWGPPTTPFGELMRDGYALVISAVAGCLAMALIARAFTSRRRVLVMAAALGLVPAILRTSAIFTGAY